MRQKPTSMTAVLTPIWQRVLQQPSVNVEDNFFDLGGDPPLAIKLFTEIAEACDRELPPVMIYHAPTIAALAALLEQRAAPQLPPLVLLKAGIEKQPVFLAHGLGGSVMEFFQLVKHIQIPHPIYGMQAKGIDGVDAPFDRIEDMAQFYLDAVKKLQPQGPYILIGHSLGGLVTLEMAQRLLANGEKVALLAMLDAYPHMRFLSLGQRIRLIGRRAIQHASTLTRSSTRDSGSVPDRPPIGASLVPAMKRVRDDAYIALKRYRPRFYSGKINFVRAEISSDFPDDPAAVWAHLADEFEVETVPGDHVGILTTHFEKLASVLSRHLRRASC